MLRYLEDAIRFAWAVRRKPIEAFMAPIAVLEEGLLCRDGSLVTLFEVEGARSIWGGGELERFVELGLASVECGLPWARVMRCRSCSSARRTAGPRWLKRCRSVRRARRRCSVSILAISSESGREGWGRLLAGETCVIAVWSREKLLPRAVQSREEKDLKAKLKAWLPKKRESQCPADVLESLPPRHEAIVATLGTLFRETGLVARQLSGGEAVGSIRRLLNGADTTPEGWLPFGPGGPVPGEGNAAARARRVAAGARAAIAGPRPGVEGRRGGDRAAELCGPRHDARTAAGAAVLGADAQDGGGQACPSVSRCSSKGAAWEGQGVVFSRVASEVLAFASQDSRHLRDAMRGLADERGEERAVVRLRVGHAYLVE